MGGVERPRSTICEEDFRGGAQNLGDLRRIGDDRDELRLGSTTGTDQQALAVRFATTLPARYARLPGQGCRM